MSEKRQVTPGMWAEAILGVVHYKASPTLTEALWCAAAIVETATHRAAYSKSDWNRLWQATRDSHWNYRIPLAPQIADAVRQHHWQGKAAVARATRLATLVEGAGGLTAESLAWAVIVALNIRRRYADEVQSTDRWWEIAWRLGRRQAGPAGAFGAPKSDDE